MDEKKLKSVRMAGREVHDYYESISGNNKIVSISYRLLNTAKVRNKKDFMDIVLRVFMGCNKSVPMIFLEIMSEKEIDFESIAYAFIAGLISEKYEPNVEGGK
ncbi:CRISPR-associated protein Cas8b1/Cst1, subtype I-B/TNEAP [Hathewaya proteolytica DSM 3090]|uniref:CRISPR-associated protein Cas8b1/Cst1, subtype I-B/TNEAP n=1 Tax=Hathewaya proteolytica DSM 3090 TaxID=1121331 RepID=A0A1M6PQY4_9CLOT|nr:type I-B CRISPR-associated protein Cas8b1/Cst1 [Hathewaya proteolytica]SHK10350.1 CRISPR-associated protein Cas8b1/Cst1, subtype I-B/TNEAP [Hathewaya proteolytica DSM 3090]